MIFSNNPIDDKCFGITKRIDPVTSKDILNKYSVCYKDNDPSDLYLNVNDQSYKLAIPFRLMMRDSAAYYFDHKFLKYDGEKYLNPAFNPQPDKYEGVNFEVNVTSLTIKDMAHNSGYYGYKISSKYGEFEYGIFEPKIVCVPRDDGTGNYLDIDDIYVACITKIEYYIDKYDDYRWNKFTCCIPTICKFTIGLTDELFASETKIYDNAIYPNSFNYVHEYVVIDDVVEDISDPFSGDDWNYTFISSLATEPESQWSGELYPYSFGGAIDIDWDPVTKKIYAIAATYDPIIDSFGQSIYLYRSSMNNLLSSYEIEKIQCLSSNALTHSCNIKVYDDKLAYSFSHCRGEDYSTASIIGFTDINANWHNTISRYIATKYVYCKFFMEGTGLYLGTLRYDGTSNILVYKVTNDAFTPPYESNMFPYNGNTYFSLDYPAYYEVLNPKTAKVKQYYLVPESNTLVSRENYVVSTFNKTYYTSYIANNYYASEEYVPGQNSYSKYVNKSKADIIYLNFNINDDICLIGYFRSTKGFPELLRTTYVYNYSEIYHTDNLANFSYYENGPDLTLRLNDQHSGINTSYNYGTTNSLIFTSVDILENGLPNTHVTLSIKGENPDKLPLFVNDINTSEFVDNKRIIFGLFLDGEPVIDYSEIVCKLVRSDITSNEFDLQIGFKLKNGDYQLDNTYAMNLFIFGTNMSPIGKLSYELSSISVPPDCSLNVTGAPLICDDNSHIIVNWTKGPTTELKDFKVINSYKSGNSNTQYPSIDCVGESGTFEINKPLPGNRVILSCKGIRNLRSTELTTESLINVQGHEYKLTGVDLYVSESETTLFDLSNKVTGNVKKGGSLNVFQSDGTAYIGAVVSCIPDEDYLSDPLDSSNLEKIAPKIVSISLYLIPYEHRFSILYQKDGREYYPNTREIFGKVLPSREYISDTITVNQVNLTDTEVFLSTTQSGTYHVVMVLVDEFNQYSSYCLTNLNDFYRIPFYTTK